MGVTSGGITAGGRLEAVKICAASGATQMVNQAAGVMVPASKQVPRIRTISCRRGAMSGALRKAVAMLVRGHRVMVTIRVTGEVRDLSMRGPARQDRRDG